MLVRNGFFDAKSAKKREGSQSLEFPLRSLLVLLRPLRQEQRFRHLDTPVKDREQFLRNALAARKRRALWESNMKRWGFPLWPFVFSE